VLQKTRVLLGLGIEPGSPILFALFFVGFPAIAQQISRVLFKALAHLWINPNHILSAVLPGELGRAQLTITVIYEAQGEWRSELVDVIPISVIRKQRLLDQLFRIAIYVLVNI